MKKCPFCAEEIQDAAIVCKHCKRELGTQQKDTMPCPFCKALVAKDSKVCPACADDISGVTGAAAQKTAASAPKLPVNPVVGLFALVVAGLMLYMMMSGSTSVSAPSSTTAAPPAATSSPATPSAALPVPAAPARTLTSPSTTPSRPSPGVAAEERRSYAPAQAASARGVMENVRGLASVEEDNGGMALLVRFNYGVLPGLERERLYQLVDTIAGADVVLHGSTRYIHFYDPTGKEVAWASPIRGIKLVE